MYLGWERKRNPDNPGFYGVYVNDQKTDSLGLLYFDGYKWRFIDDIIVKDPISWCVIKRRFGED